MEPWGISIFLIFEQLCFTMSLVLLKTYLAALTTMVYIHLHSLIRPTILMIIAPSILKVHT